MHNLKLGMIVLLLVGIAGKTMADEVDVKRSEKSQQAGFCHYDPGQGGWERINRMTEEILSTQDPSYVILSPHYGMGASFGSDTTSRNILFEGRISHRFHVFGLSCLSKLSRDHLEGFLSFNPKIILRMYRGTSVPVKTPSYMPDFTWFFWRPDWSRGSNRWFVSARIGHHSNGQSGPFMRAGSVNTEDGNFSTNYWRFGMHNFRHEQTLDWSWELAFTSHFGSSNGFFSRERGLEGQYEKQKFSLGLKAGGSDVAAGWVRAINAALNIDYISKGKDYVVKPVQRASFADRWNLSAELMVRPYFFEDMQLFAKYDFGYDYYNIHFQERINRVMLGIAGVIGGR
ncbi:MAG: hypothetical protein D6816_19695 [Bacteroidetes bacterium]|nr:MAG: hypothetical protein D6816_19695 [Bacteroidota bacterium]